METPKKMHKELNDIGKENPFRVPDHYFDDFAARLQTRIESEQHPQPKTTPLIIRMLKPTLGLAAGFALIFMLVYVPMKTFMNRQTEITSLAESNYDEIPIQSILEQMDEASFFSMLNSEDENESNFTEEDLYAYVSTNFNAYEVFEYTEN